MKRTFKVLSTASIAAVIAGTSITPVVAVENPVAQEKITEYAVIKDGEILKVSVEEYNEALIELDDKVEKVTVYLTSTGNAYYVEDFNEALVEADGNTAEAIKMLDEEDESLALDLKQVDSYIDDEGKFVYDKVEQPEDRLNETFFYNAA